MKGSSMAAADREGSMEVPLALLVNQLLSYALRNVNLFFTNPAWFTSIYLTPKYVFFVHFRWIPIPVTHSFVGIISLKSLC